MKTLNTMQIVARSPTHQKIPVSIHVNLPKTFNPKKTHVQLKKISKLQMLAFSWLKFKQQINTFQPLYSKFILIIHDLTVAKKKNLKLKKNKEHGKHYKQYITKRQEAFPPSITMPQPEPPQACGGVQGLRGSLKPFVPSGPLGCRTATTLGPYMSSLMLFIRLKRRSGRCLSLQRQTNTVNKLQIHLIS